MKCFSFPSSPTWRWSFSNRCLALVASQAHCVKADRAVVISTRNFCRTFGAATGLAICAAIFSNVLQACLPASLPESFRQTVTASIFKTPNLSVLNPDQREGVLDAYAHAARAVFILWAPTMLLCFLSMTFVEDKGLERPDEKSNPVPVPVDPVLEDSVVTPDEGDSPSRHGHEKDMDIGRVEATNVQEAHASNKRGKGEEV